MLTMTNFKTINEACMAVVESVDSLQILDDTHDFLDFFYRRRDEFEDVRACLLSKSFISYDKTVSTEEKIKDVIKISEIVMSRSDTLILMKNAADEISESVRRNTVPLYTGFESLDNIKAEVQDILSKYIPQSRNSVSKSLGVNPERHNIHAPMRDPIPDSSNQFCIIQDLLELPDFKKLSCLVSIEKCPVKSSSPLGPMAQEYMPSSYALDTYFTVAGNTHGCAFLYPPEGYTAEISQNNSTLSAIPKAKIGDLNKRGVGQVLGRWQLSSGLLEQGFLVLYSPALKNFPTTCALMRGDDFNPGLEEEIELTSSIRDVYHGEAVKLSPGRDIIGLRQSSNNLLLMFREQDSIRKVSIKFKSHIVDFAIDKCNNSGEQKENGLFIVAILLKNGDVLCHKLNAHGSTIITAKSTSNLPKTEFTSILTSIHKNGNNLLFLLGLKSTQDDDSEYVPTLKCFLVQPRPDSEMSLEHLNVVDKTKSEFEVFSCTPTKMASSNDSSISHITTAIATLDDSSTDISIFNTAVCYPWINKVIFALIHIPSSFKEMSCHFEIVEPCGAEKNSGGMRVQAVPYLHRLQTKPSKTAISIIQKRLITEGTTLQEMNCGAILHFSK